MGERFDRLVPVPGSDYQAAAGYVAVDDDITQQQISVTVRVRRKKPLLKLDLKGPLKSRTYPTREAFASDFGASDIDLKKVVNYATANNLKVPENTQVNSAQRTVPLVGAVGDFEQAFGVKLSVYRRLSGETYVGYEGTVRVPLDLHNIVEGVFGLDNRPIGVRRTSFRLSSGMALPKPTDIATHYQFPDLKAPNQCIALMEFGGGYLQTDIDAYFGIGKSPALVEVQVDGAKNDPGKNDDYDREVTLDIDIAGSVAQGATLALYFAPHTEQGWINSFNAAVYDCTNKPSVISVSWGCAELQKRNTLVWSYSGMNSLREIFEEAAQLGITVLAAAGDEGSDCGVGNHMAHVLYPASDPHVIGIGGTTISDFAAAPDVEVPWSRGGGGVSDFFDVPSFQEKIDLPLSVNTGQRKRGVPDIAGYADPGFSFIWKGNSFDAIGTSLTTPLYAGLVAQLNYLNGSHLGYITPVLYEFGTLLFQDIGGSTTNSFNFAPGYHGGPGWDARTGLGVLEGPTIQSYLKDGKI